MRILHDYLINENTVLFTGVFDGWNLCSKVIEGEDQFLSGNGSCRADQQGIVKYRLRFSGST